MSKIGEIFKYELFFNDGFDPSNKIELIKNVPKIEVISVISSINHLIKKPIELEFNNSFDIQIKILKTIFPIIDDRVISITEKLIYLNQTRNGTLFTRVSCLYALNEVLHSNEFVNENVLGYQFNVDDCLAIFKFMLLSNNSLLQYNNVYDEDYTYEVLQNTFFEAFMFKELPHNQYYSIQNPFNLFNRALGLFNYIKQYYEPQLKEYFDEFKIANIDEFIGVVGKYCLSPGSLPNKLHCFYVDNTDEESISRLDKLSVRGKGKPNEGLRKFEFMEIKKSPFYKVEGDEKSIYVLMDNIFLIEKVYDLFYWDFFFDKISVGLNRRDRESALKKWGGEIGLFFESYIKSILDYIYKGREDIVYKTAEELKLDDNNEFSDLYIRRDNNVIVGQAKCSYISQIKYKEVYSLDDYYNLDKDEFYKRFGLFQLVDTTILKFENYIEKIDCSSPSSVTVYPVLVVNEPIVSNVIFPKVFAEKFKNELRKKGFNFENENFNLKRLIVIHIGELERIQQSLKDKDFEFDHLLQKHLDETNLSITGDPYSEFLNFDLTIKKNIKGKAIPEYLLDNNEGFKKLMIDFLNLK